MSHFPSTIISSFWRSGMTISYSVIGARSLDEFAVILMCVKISASVKCFTECFRKFSGSSGQSSGKYILRNVSRGSIQRACIPYPAAQDVKKANRTGMHARIQVVSCKVYRAAMPENTCSADASPVPNTCF